MQSTNPTTGEIRPNFATLYPAIADSYDALGVSLARAEAVLCLIVQAYELPRQCGEAVAALEKLFVSVATAHSRFCTAVADSRLLAEAGRPETLLQSACVLAQLRAVLELLMESQPAPDKIFSGLCAVQSLAGLFKAELAQAWKVLVKAGQADAEAEQDKSNAPTPANAHRPALAQKTERGKMAFAHAEDGFLRMGGGTTPLSTVWGMGALMATRREVDGMKVTATDEAGLEALSDNLGEFSEDITPGVAAISKAMALACGDLSTEEIRELGWIMCGLSELAKEADQFRQHLRFELMRDFRDGE